MTVGELREMLEDFDENDEVEFLTDTNLLDETYIEMNVNGKHVFTEEL